MSTLGIKQSIKSLLRNSFNSISGTTPKYELVPEDTIEGRSFSSRGEPMTLFRIRALIDIPRHNVKAGDLGGYIETTDCLSDRGDCWVGGNARISKDARVLDNALVTDEAVLVQDAKAMGNAIVRGQSELNQWSVAAGSARIEGRSSMTWHSRADGNAQLQSGRLLMNTHASGNTIIRGEAPLSAKDNAYMDRLFETDPVYKHIAKGSLGPVMRTAAEEGHHPSLSGGDATAGQPLRELPESDPIYQKMARGGLGSGHRKP